MLICTEKPGEKKKFPYMLDGDGIDYTEFEALEA
jgi:hypothetical protein